VLELDENNPLANVGVGKALLSAGNNEEAMVYLRRGMDIHYYSIAFRRWRTEVLKDNINLILTAVTLAAIAIAGYKLFVKKGKNGANEDY
jgi:hypothetical protein